MSCQKIREWLENSSVAGLHAMPAELGRHLKYCPGCSALLVRLNAQCVVKLPDSLNAGIPDMKKHVLSQIGKQNAHSEDRAGAFAWPAFWKLALLPFLIILLVAAYFVTDKATRVSGQKILSGRVVATVVRVNSLVEKLCAGTTDYVKAMPADRLFAGDVIRTGGSASAELLFADSSKVLLGSGAWFKLNEEKHIGEHLRGRAVFEIEKQTPPASVEVLTPQGVTAVLGTKFVQEIGETNCFIAVSDGIVEFRPNNQEPQLLRPGNLLCFDSSGKITDRSEPGVAVILRLYDLNNSASLEAAVSLENGSPDLMPAVGPASMTDTVATSTQKVNKPVAENRLSSDSIQASPAVDLPAIASDDISVPDTSGDSVFEEPDQPSESGQSSLGVSGF